MDEERCEIKENAQRKIETQYGSGKTETLVRIIALVAFVTFFSLDKVNGSIKPLPEYWYGLSAAIFAFGNRVAGILDKVLKK